MSIYTPKTCELGAEEKKRVDGLFPVKASDELKVLLNEFVNREL